MKNPNQISSKPTVDQTDSSKLLKESPETTPKQSGESTGSSADFSRFRLSQNFGSVSGVKKQLSTVPVRKPNKTQWVRVHPEKKMDAKLLKYGEKDEDLYFVEPELQAEVEQLARAHRLVLAIDRQGDPFLWPIVLPDENRRLNWHLSALEAAQNAELEWTRIQSNMNIGAYDIFTAEGNLKEPEWPELSLDEILDIAFKNKIINRLDHQVLLQLRGAA